MTAKRKSHNRTVIKNTTRESTSGLRAYFWVYVDMVLPFIALTRQG